MAHPHKQFFGDYPGFEAFRADHVNDMTIEMVKGRLTQSLSKNFGAHVPRWTNADQKQITSPPSSRKRRQKPWSNFVESPTVSLPPPPSVHLATAGPHL